MPRPQSLEPAYPREKTMSTINHNANRAPVWGIDPTIVEAAIAKGRRERSEAFWSLLATLFGRQEDGHHGSQATDPNAIAAR